MAKFKRGSLTLARQVFNTPQLILADDLQNIAQYLVNRANGIEMDLESFENNDEVEKELRQPLSEEEQRERKYRQLGITNDGKRGNLNVTGTLVPKAGSIDADCMELTSYEKLHNTFVQQVNEGIEELVLHVDSGGGSAFSCFEMATEVKKLAVEKDIKIYAYVDGLSASAAYAWTSIADEIIARPDSEVGSVGVVVQLINNSKMLENIGITRQFVCHGEQKVPFAENGEFSPQFISSIQKKVDKTGKEFSNFIATNRNLSVQSVLNTQAEVFDSEEALAVGFIDKIMTKSEFYNTYLPSLNSKSQSDSFVNRYGLSVEEKQDSVLNGKSTKEETMNNSEKDKTVIEASDTQSPDLAATMTAQLEKMELDNKALTNQLAEVTAKLEAKDSEYAELMANMQEAELNQRLATRKMALEDALGKDNDKVESLLSTTESLSDEQFEIIATSLATSQDKTNQHLAELGGEGQESNLQLSIADQIKKTAETMNRKAH